MDDLTKLMAERDIRRRLVDYCRGIDTCDADLVASAYHEGAYDDHGGFKGDGHEFAVYATKALRRYRATMHSIGASQIDFRSATEADVVTYVIAQHVGVDNGGEFVEHFGGEYQDRFELRDGDWKIAHRVCVHRWDKREHVELAFAPGTFTEAERVPSQ